MAYVIIDVAEFNFLQFRSYLQIIFESMDFFVKCLSGIVNYVGQDFLAYFNDFYLCISYLIIF